MKDDVKHKIIKPFSSESWISQAVRSMTCLFVTFEQKDVRS